MEECKILVKFYSEEPLENVMAMIKYEPEKIIFLGHKDNMVTRKINDIKHFRDLRCPNVYLEFTEVPKDDLNGAIAMLTDIIREYPDVKFDLTGGSELILIALGCINARMEISNIRIDPFTGKEMDINDGEIITSDYKFNISIAEEIVLHGGVLTGHTGSYSDWRFTEEFRADIRTMWGICSRYRGRWNKHCARIDELRKSMQNQNEGWVELYKKPLGDAIELLQDLSKAGLIKEYRVTGNKVIFKFKNDMIKRVIGKAGNILELHVYEVATREKYQ